MSLSWLPQRFDYEDYQGDWQQFSDDVYGTFSWDFIESKPYICGQHVWHRASIIGKYREGFWHIVSQEPKGDVEREAQIDRWERVPWVRPIIEHADQVHFWVEERHGKSNLMLWLEAYDYLVVLEEARDGFRLVTAHIVRYENKRKDLMRSLEEFKKKGVTPCENVLRAPPTPGR